MFCCAAAAAADTYYVSPSGSDENEGWATNAAWRTLARVNATSFDPGDCVLFERGGEWRESLVPACSGTPANPITFAAYGSGPKPRFWGSEILANGAFEWLTGTTYRIAFTTEVTSVLADHAFLFGNTPSLPITSVADVQARSNSWYWSADVLYVNAGNHDPRTDGRVYTAVVRDNIILANYRSNLVFRNLAADESARYNAGYGVRAMGSVNILMEDCDAFRCGKHHFGAINTTGFVGRRLYGAYAMPAQGMGGATTFVSYSDYNYHDTTSEWLDCVVEHMEDTYSGGVYPAFYTHGEGIGSVLVSNITSVGANVSMGGTNMTVIGGHIHNAGLSVYSARSRANGLRITGPKGGIALNGRNNLIENCVVTGSDPRAGYKTAVACGGVSNTLRFCTIVLSSNAPATSACLALTTTDTHTRWYGNVMLATDYAFRLWYTDLAPSDIDEANHNAYHAGARFKDQSGVRSFAEWQALGHDAQGLSGDPAFVDPGATNLHLTADSACVDAVTAGAVPPIDFDGVSRPLDGDTNGVAVADIGAFEFAHPAADTDGDGMHDADEVVADTDACDPGSRLALTGIARDGAGVRVRWLGGRAARQVLESVPFPSAASGSWSAIFTNEPPTSVTNAFVDGRPGMANQAYRVRARRP